MGAPVFIMRRLKRGRFEIRTRKEAREARRVVAFEDLKMLVRIVETLLMRHAAFGEGLIRKFQAFKKACVTCRFDISTSVVPESLLCVKSESNHAATGHVSLGIAFSSLS